MSRADWRREFGSRAAEARDAAHRMGMVELNTRYSTGRPGTDAYPQSVRLSPEFRDGRTYECELSRQPRTRSAEIDAPNLRPAGIHLAAMLPRFAIDGRPRSAMDALTARFFAAGKHRPHRCQFGRFHSLATALPKYLRASITPNNVPHMDTDAAEESPPPPDLGITGGSPSVPRRGLELIPELNSPEIIGPIRAHRLASDKKRGSRRPEHKATPATAAELVHLDVANCQSLCIAAMAAGRFGPSLPPDAGRWLELCQAGQLYEAIRDWLAMGEIPPYSVSWRGRTLTIDPSCWDRAKVKHQFMVAIFGRPEQSAACPIWIAIERMFPSIAGLCLGIKRGKYQRLAHDCQRLESAIVIDGVCGHLAQHHPDLPVLTVHDCLVVPAADESLIRDLLAEHFGRQGVVPFVRREVLS